MRLDDTGKVYYGHRHNNCIESASGELSWTMNRQEMLKIKKTQGFVTSEGRFVDREEAWKIAEIANQIIRQSGGKGTLYSEDLY